MCNTGLQGQNQKQPIPTCPKEILVLFHILCAVRLSQSIFVMVRSDIVFSFTNSINPSLHEQESKRTIITTNTEAFLRKKQQEKNRSKMGRVVCGLEVTM